MADIPYTITYNRSRYGFCSFVKSLKYILSTVQNAHMFKVHNLYRESPPNRIVSQHLHDLTCIDAKIIWKHHQHIFVEKSKTKTSVFITRILTLHAHMPITLWKPQVALTFCIAHRLVTIMVIGIIVRWSANNCTEDATQCKELSYCKGKLFVVGEMNDRIRCVISNLVLVMSYSLWITFLKCFVPICNNLSLMYVYIVVDFDNLINPESKFCSVTEVFGHSMIFYGISPDYRNHHNNILIKQNSFTS